MKDEKDLEKELEIINEILKDIPAIAYAKVHKINLDLAGVFYVNAWLQFLEGEKAITNFKMK